MSFTPKKTERNYELMEVSSAIQKAIRRNDEQVALYFAIELFNSNYDEYLWKRLRIIASEDVGLASPNTCVIIRTLYENFVELKKNRVGAKRPERLFLVHAVLHLCRSPKSRLVDWATIYHVETHNGPRMEIPDYAYDKHNYVGRHMGRGLKHFYEESSKLENHKIFDGEDDYRNKAYKAQSDKSGAQLFGEDTDE